MRTGDSVAENHQADGSDESEEGEPETPAKNPEKRSIKVKFEGMEEGPSPPPGLDLKNASRDELIDRIISLQERLTQAQVGLKKEKRLKQRKEKNILKLAAELGRQQKEGTQKQGTQKEQNNRRAEIILLCLHVCVMLLLLLLLLYASSSSSCAMAYAWSPQTASVRTTRRPFLVTLREQMSADGNLLQPVTSLRQDYFALRHGQSLANVQGIIMSNPNVTGYGLSEVGQQQAERAAALVRQVYSDNPRYHQLVILSSDLLRAQETAAAIWRRNQDCEIFDDRVVTETRIRERWFGEWDGTSDDNYHQVWADDAVDATHNNNGVESVEQVMQRTTSCILEWDQRLSNPDGRRAMVILVAHGDVLQILQTAFEKRNGRQHRSLPHLETAQLRQLHLKRRDDSSAFPSSSSAKAMLALLVTLQLSSWMGGLPAAMAATSTFRTAARAEYTNSITATRDTNVSPQEAYDSILKYLPPVASDKAASSPRALDVGAGAGLSTSYLYNRLGYKAIDAVDWSGDAWRANVQETPESVRFFEMDDDSFFAQTGSDAKYDIICYNFAINPSKAIQVAQRHLKDDEGVLFAPVNDRPEYWYKQTYYLLNARGEILQKSEADVGAWAVQFQPDVTSESCIGIWCGNANGFLEKRRASGFPR